MSVTIIFPDGKREACVAEACEAVPGAREVYVAEADDGYLLQNFSDDQSEQPLMALTIFGKNQPCRWLFAIAYAFEAGKTFNGLTDKAQESSGFYHGFTADGEPVLDDNINIGFVADPLGQMAMLEVARQVLKRFGVCYFRPPPPKTPVKEPSPEQVPVVGSAPSTEVKRIREEFRGVGAQDAGALVYIGATLAAGVAVVKFAGRIAIALAGS